MKGCRYMMLFKWLWLKLVRIYPVYGLDILVNTSLIFVVAASFILGAMLNISSTRLLAINLILAFFSIIILIFIAYGLHLLWKFLLSQYYDFIYFKANGGKFKRESTEVVEIQRNEEHEISDEIYDISNEVYDEIYNEPTGLKGFIEKRKNKYE